MSASGGFNSATWQSTGVAYAVDLDSSASPGEVDALLQAVDAVAEIPKAIRAGACVARVTQMGAGPTVGPRDLGGRP